MAVQVLVDHGVPEEKIVFVTYFAGRMGLMRLTKVFPGVKVVVCTIVADFEERVCVVNLLASLLTSVLKHYLPPMDSQLVQTNLAISVDRT